MTDPSRSLLIGKYNDSAAAEADLADVKAVDDLNVVASAALTRDFEGIVEERAHAGRLLAYCTEPGALAALVVGLFAPPLLLSSAIGDRIGGGIAEILELHERRGLGVDVDVWLPNGSSAFVAIVDDDHLYRVDRAVERAVEKTTSALDEADYDSVVIAVNRGGDKIVQVFAL
jgi:hypothetical protein